ncbi:hypothetical protein GCM10027343_19990 [Noviherbaspirillum agri]
MVTTLSRRTFLKAGIAGALVLASAGGIYRLTRQAELPEKFALDENIRSVLTALIPVMLRDAIEPASTDLENAIAGVHDAITGLPLATQKEVQDLFGMLTLGPIRRFLAGIPDDWPQAKAEDVEAFLQNWRFSRFTLLQSAYHALHDLITGSWYGKDSSWAAIGYPGPIKALS